MNSGESIVTIRARALAFGGEIVGEVAPKPGTDESLLGITAFVPFVVPGEQVQGRIIERKKRYVRAELVAVDEPSAARVVPPCPFFGACGGCELQHIEYSTQLALKYEMVRGALAAGKLSIAILNRLNPVVASSPYHYRRRVSLHLDRSGGVGFYRAGSRSVVVVDSCAISVPAINKALENITQFGPLVSGRISSIQLESDQHGVIAVLKTPYDLAKAEIAVILGHAKRFFENAVLISGTREIGGFGRQILEVPLDGTESLTASIPAGYFSQVNWEINLKLVEHVIRGANLLAGKQVLDLYSGAGNFSLALAREGARVTAVENDTRLVAFGRQNASRNQLDRAVTFVESPVERYLETLSGKSFDAILADPPRSGLGSSIDRLPATKRLLLISCHLPSFVRDLKSLLDRGYEVEEITPYDMFAQTSSLEILAVLSRK